MKLLNETPDPLRASVADCIAHRCMAHREVPPLNMSEGNGSSECGVCAAEEFGQRLAEQALEIQWGTVVLDLLDGYADRLDHHALLRDRLAAARDRLNLASPGAGDFLDEYL